MLKKKIEIESAQNRLNYFYTEMKDIVFVKSSVIVLFWHFITLHLQDGITNRKRPNKYFITQLFPNIYNHFSISLLTDVEHQIKIACKITTSLPTWVVGIDIFQSGQILIFFNMVIHLKSTKHLTQTTNLKCQKQQGFDGILNEL